MSSEIGYHNIFETGTVSASTEATDYPKENAYDWRPFDWWQPTAVPASLTVDMGSAVDVDYFGLAAHDIGTNSGTVVLQYSSDNFAADINNAFTAVSPTDDGVIFKTFATITARYWRVYLTGAVSSLGVVAVGERFTLANNQQVGFSPAPLARNNELLTSESETGVFLGRTIKRTGYPGTLGARNVTPSWVRTNWIPFIDHAELKPFFFSWDQTNYEGDAILAWAKGPIPAVAYQDSLYQSVSLGYNSIL